jgi:uncharacterized membrane protein YqhA
MKLARIEQIFQNFIWESKVMIVIPVFLGILSALIMILFGLYDVCYSLYTLVDLFGAVLKWKTSTVAVDILTKDVMSHIIASVDAFLIATVLLIFSIGLYELFINKISKAEHERGSRILLIRNLDQLKEKLAKVIIMVLIVSYFKLSLSFEYRSVSDLLYLSIGILLVSLAVYFTQVKKKE